MIQELVLRTAPHLVEPFGIGIDTAAEILIVVGDNPERIRSEAALAKLAGISPISASSGMTPGRHRINSGGHRQLNAANYRTVIVRMRFHQPTIDYVARRTAEGHSKRDIIRCLNRYVIRGVFHLIHPAETPPERRVENHKSTNVMAEAVNGLYKTERIRRRGPSRTVEEVELSTVESVRLCNNQRLTPSSATETAPRSKPSTRLTSNHP